MTYEMVDFRALLRDPLRHLAMNAEDQMAYLARSGRVHVDELALEYDDVALMAAGKLREGEITEAQHDKIMALDAALDRMSKRENAALWTEDALRRSDEWKEVRHIAQECLRILGTD